MFLARFMQYRGRMETAVESSSTASAVRKTSTASEAGGRRARAPWRRSCYAIFDAKTNEMLDWLSVVDVRDYRGRDHALPIFPSRSWPEMMVRGYPLPNLRSETGRKLVVRKVRIEEAR